MMCSGNQSQSLSYGITPATGHRWMCPTLTPAGQVGAGFTCPGGMEGCIDLRGWIYTEMVYLSAGSHLCR